MDVRGRGGLEERSGTADAGREVWASSGGERDRGEISDGPQELASATPVVFAQSLAQRQEEALRLFDLQAVAPLGAQDLTHRGAGQFRHEHELAGPLVWREMGAAVRDQIGFADVAGGDDEGRDLLTLARFDEADHGDLLDPRMAGEHGLDLGRVHIRSSAYDQVRAAGEQPDEA